MSAKKKRRQALKAIAVALLKRGFNDFVDEAAATHKQALMQEHKRDIQQYSLTEAEILNAAKQLLRRIQ